MNRSKVIGFLLVFLSILIVNISLGVKSAQADLYWCGATYCCAEVRGLLTAVNWPGGTVHLYCNGDNGVWINGVHRYFCIGNSQNTTPGSATGSFDFNRCSCANPSVGEDGCLHWDTLPAGCTMYLGGPQCTTNGHTVWPAPYISCIPPQVSLTYQCSDTSSTVRLNADWRVAGNSCTVRLQRGTQVDLISSSCQDSGDPGWTGTSMPSGGVFASGQSVLLRVRYYGTTIAGEQTVNIDCTPATLNPITVWPCSTGFGGTISWSDMGDPSYIVDISSTSSNFTGTYYNKTVTGTSTDFPAGFLSNDSLKTPLVLSLGVTYYVRVYRITNNRHSNTESFTMTDCAGTPTPTPTPAPTDTPTPTPTPFYTVTAHVYNDKNYNNCTDATPIPYDNGSGGGTTLNLYGPMGYLSGAVDSDSAAGYSFTNLLPGNYTLSATIPSGYSVRSVQGNTTNKDNNYLFDVTTTPVVTYCISSIQPWYQTFQGDVRMPRASNVVALNKFASDSSIPSVFISTISDFDFGAGGASAICGGNIGCWTVNYEYFYNNLSIMEKGGLSYDFFNTRAHQAGISIIPITASSGYGSLDNLNLTNLNGVYEIDSGGIPVVIKSYVHAASNSHVVLLVKGDVTISGPIKVPAASNNLFILASSGDISIDPSVGVDTSIFPYPDTSNTDANSVYAITQLDGIYSAEGNFIVNTSTNTCSDGVSPDLRLNIGGTVIANSLFSFSAGGFGGRFSNQRSLCANDASYPSVKIYPRYDFLTAMSDFYKENVFTWREIQP